MLRRRFMMKRGALYTYHCKFRINYGGKVDKYFLNNQKGYYGCGFYVTTEIANTSTVNTYAQFYLNTIIDNEDYIEQSSVIVKNGNTIVYENNDFKFINTTATSDESRQLSGGLCFIDLEQPTSILKYEPNAIQVTYNSNYLTIDTKEAGLYTSNYFRLKTVWNNGLAQTNYDVEITIKTSIKIDKLKVWNVGASNTYTENKVTKYKHCASLCKVAWLESDNVFEDNMYKENGVI